LELLQSVNLDETETSSIDVPDHILGPNPDDNSQLSASEDEEDEDISVAAAPVEQELLSDAEKAQQVAQHVVMLELVFGRNTPATNPVDAKIETMIRELLQKSLQPCDTVIIILQTIMLRVLVVDLGKGNCSIQDILLVAR
jgi:hypothetical protein